MTTARDIAIPTFDELPIIEQTGERHAWDVFGRDDELGCLNFVGPEQVAAAAREATAGQVVNLNLPIGEPHPQFWADRPAVEHHSVRKHNIRDDYLDNFPMQGSTHWDGLRHQRYREFGWFGGRLEDAVDERRELGIERWASRGIIARGVLVDVAGHYASTGRPIDPSARFSVSARVLEEVLSAQRTEVRDGDILLIRTGWMGWYRGMEEARRAALCARLRADRGLIAMPGLDARPQTVAWLWDHRIAALAFDNPSADALPYLPEHGWAHNRLIPLLGMTLGELWQLDDLATACDVQGRYSFLLSASPLNLIGGAGSPANAYAVL